MAIASTALSLAEYAQASNNPLIMKVVFSLRQAGSILTDIPFMTKPTMIASGARITGNLPTVGWVPLNTAPTAVKTQVSQFQESAFILRNTIEVDHLMVEDQNSIQDPRGLQTSAYLKAVAYDINDKFINNNHASGNANAFVGIRQRLDDPTTYGALAASKIDAAGAVITTAATAAQANAFLEWIDQLLWALNAPEGDGCVLYMNDTMMRRFHFLLRLLGTQGGLATNRDQFDRIVLTYKGAVLKDVGTKGDQSTRVITATETAAGVDGSSLYTSIYGVRYGEDALTGWQFAPLVAKDLGQDPTDGVVYRTFIEWAGGLFMSDVRAIARIYDLKIS